MPEFSTSSLATYPTAESLLGEIPAWCRTPAPLILQTGVRKNDWRRHSSPLGCGKARLAHFGSAKVFGSTLSTALNSVVSSDRNFLPSRLFSTFVAFLMPPKSL